MRQQRPRGATTREAIVSAAVDVVDSVGVDALTIRAVAKAVGAPPMSLYTHFGNKEELLDLMYAEVSRRLYPDSGQPTWQGELLALGRHVRSTLLQHPRWTPLLSRYSVPVVVTVRERVLGLMIADGIPPAAALQSLAAVFLAVLGLCLTELQFRGPDGASSLGRRFDQLREEFEQADETSQLPATRLAFKELRRLNLESTFDLALTRLIDGIAGSRES